MAVNSKQFKENGTQFYPETHVEAVIDGNGTTLNTLLGDTSAYDYSRYENVSYTKNTGYFRYDTLTTGGNSNYYYAVFSVSPGEQYKITGYNIDVSSVPAAFVVKDGTSTKAVVLGQAATARMTGTYTIPEGYDTLYVNGRVNNTEVWVFKMTQYQGSAIGAVQQLRREVFGDFKADPYINYTIDANGLFSDSTKRVVNMLPVNTGGDVRVVCGGDVRINSIVRYNSLTDPTYGGVSGTDFTANSISSTDYIVQYDSGFPNTYIIFSNSDASLTITAGYVSANVRFVDLNCVNERLKQLE